jgi:hypothetical protein
MNELNTVKEIRTFGLEEFVKKHNLKYKDYGHKFSLKYHQLDTKKTPSTNECRGLVLSNDLEVLSLPLIRFSNYSENTIKSIDWNTARYYEKGDGSMVHYYADPISDKWCVGTTGTAEAVDNVSHRDKATNEVHNYDFNLTELFLNTCSDLGIDLEKCVKGCSYVFELMTEYNKVINKTEKDTVKLLAIRDLSDLSECPQRILNDFAKHIGCERPKEYFFSTQEEMIKSLNNVRYGDVNFEGYVIVDDNFNRLKVKSNTYILHSHFNSDKQELVDCKWRLTDVVIHNEIEEVSASFPSLRDILEKMKINYDALILPIREKFEYLKENFDTLERKDFFIEASNSINHEKSKKPILSVFTQLFNDKNIDFEKAMDVVKRDKLYKLIK